MKHTKRRVLTALGAACLILCAWLSIPAPIPFTLQTLGVLTLAALFGAKESCLCVGVYLLLGLLGLPVFSGFQGGVQVLFGPTGGYLLGFLPCAWLIGWAAQRHSALPLLSAAMAGGLLLCYAFGTAWYALLYGGRGVTAIVLSCVVPFLLPDALKLLLALILVKRIRGSGVLANPGELPQKIDKASKIR